MVARTFFAIGNANMVDNTTGVGIVNNSSTPDGRTFTYNGGGGTTVTVDDNGGNQDVFNDDQAVNHTILDGGGLVGNGTTVESESIIFIRALDDAGNPTGPDISLYIFSQNGNFGDVWGFASDTELVAGSGYIKVGGSNAGSSVYADYAPCFAGGTLIETSDGEMPVEKIKSGQLVWTQDAGLQPVKWSSSVHVSGTGNLAPVVFARGALGNSDELVVSPQHRMLVSGSSAELLFGTTEVFVAAKHLVGLDGVSFEERADIEYCHFMFDRHHIVRANGLLAESFFLADTGIRALDMGARGELLSLFPTLESGKAAFGKSALMCLTAREANMWCHHAQPIEVRLS